MEQTLSAPRTEEWYAMRATYRRELQAQSLLKEAGIRSYIPMRTGERTVNGRRRRMQVPAVHNLIFVYAAREALQRIKERVTFLQYMMDRSGHKAVPIIVPDKAMEDFMRVVDDGGDTVDYLPVGDRNFTEGMKVRVHGGPLDGVEGILVKSGKSKDRKLVVSLSGILSVATASVNQDSLEILEND